jgi:phosphoribosylformylglycinamidine synthase
MIYQIEISLKPQFRDKHGEHVKHEISGLGVKGISEVKYRTVYSIEGELSRQQAERISSRLLIDPITEKYAINSDISGIRKKQAAGHGSRVTGLSVEIWFKKGVTDTVADSVSKAVKDIGINEALKIKTGHKFTFTGKVSPAVIKQAVAKLLYNPMIQECKLK